MLEDRKFYYPVTDKYDPYRPDREMPKDTKFPVIIASPWQVTGPAGAVEMVKDRTTKEQNPHVVEELVLGAFHKGLLLLGAGPSALRLAPPLVVDAEDIDTGLRIIDEVLSAM